MWVLCSGLLEHDFLPLYNPLHLITMPWGLLADRIIAWDGWNIKNTTARSTQLRCWKLQKHHKYHKSVNNNALECCQQQGRPNTAKSTTAMLFDSKWVKRVGESEAEKKGCKQNRWWKWWQEKTILYQQITRKRIIDFMQFVANQFKILYIFVNTRWDDCNSKRSWVKCGTHDLAVRLGRLLTNC